MWPVVHEKKIFKGYCYIKVKNIYRYQAVKQKEQLKLKGQKTRL